LGFYERHLFNPVMDRVLSGSRLGEVRQRALASCRGRVLEIGPGTGLNLRHYPADLEQLTAVGPEPTFDRRAQRRARDRDLVVDYVAATAQGLPLDAAAFDTVVSTFVLCTVGDPLASLREVARVLAPDGRLLFVEHIPSARPHLRRLQRLIERPHRWLACGCSLVRPLEPTLRAAGLVPERLERAEVPGVPWPYRHVAHGVAAVSPG
jgi:ubiquinone/menaquinone biosynthesis C-methylase UbiE